MTIKIINELPSGLDKIIDENEKERKNEYSPADKVNLTGNPDEILKKMTNFQLP